MSQNIDDIIFTCGVCGHRHSLNSIDVNNPGFKNATLICESCGYEWIKNGSLNDEHTFLRRSEWILFDNPKMPLEHKILIDELAIQILGRLMDRDSITTINNNDEMEKRCDLAYSIAKIMMKSRKKALIRKL